MKELQQRAAAAQKRLNQAGLHDNDQIIGFYKGLYGSTHSTYNSVNHVLKGTETDQTIVERLEDMADQVERRFEKDAAKSDFDNADSRFGNNASSNSPGSL